MKILKDFGSFVLVEKYGVKAFTVWKSGEPLLTPEMAYAMLRGTPISITVKMVGDSIPSITMHPASYDVSTKVETENARPYVDFPGLMKITGDNFEWKYGREYPFECTPTKVYALVEDVFSDSKIIVNSCGAYYLLSELYCKWNVCSFEEAKPIERRGLFVKIGKHYESLITAKNMGNYVRVEYEKLGPKVKMWSLENTVRTDGRGGNHGP